MLLTDEISQEWPQLLLVLTNARWHALSNDTLPTGMIHTIFRTLMAGSTYHWPPHVLLFY